MTDPSEKQAVLRAMITTLKSITEGNFSAAGSAFRITPWANKYNGSPATLRKSGTLWKSFHVTVAPDHATLSNPAIYAAIHQFGGPIRPKAPNTRLCFKTPEGWRSPKEVQIPARPFVPVDANGQLSPAAADLLSRAAERVLARIFGGQT